MSVLLPRIQAVCSYCAYVLFRNRLCPILMLWFRRCQKWFYVLLLALILLVVYVMISILTKPRVIPGSIVPSANFEISLVKQPDRPIIMITYWGRLGNHMFEYGTLLGVAKRNGMIPIIPKQIDLLDVFNLPTQQGDLDLLDMHYIYNEEKAAAYFNKTEHLKPYNALLAGYYQSWKYFENVKDELISKHFVYKDEIKKKAKKFLEKVLTLKNKHGAALVGVHVRRGDFVRQTLKGYTAAPLSYFYQAMNYFRKKYGNVLFIVCSNDIFWAEDNLDIGPDVYYSHNPDGNVDLAVLTSCSHMIITAGSYSWWAGYMVPGDVVYFKGFPQPNTKIGNMTVREDYYPPHWIPM
ncbi:galactoside 2-alpha-L-fucosyltransferase Sec1-like [Haliotis asinina]|uniref:galactoside 2-alpha-L-fucosyltransferase Sec1-like n=1 Tax=Haliotis asinina TaxID=109174 RepID=UPI003531FC43